MFSWPYFEIPDLAGVPYETLVISSRKMWQPRKLVSGTPRVLRDETSFTEHWVMRNHDYVYS